MRTAKRTQPLYPKATRKLPELKQKEQTTKTRFPAKGIFRRFAVPLATLVLLTLLGNEFVKKQRDEQPDSSQEDTLHDSVKKRHNRHISLPQEDITQRLAPLISESQEDEQPISSQEDITQRLAPLISESQEEDAYGTSVDTRTKPPNYAPRGRTEHSPDSPRLPTKRLLRRIGIALAILIVLSIAGKALYDSLAFQDITAFKVGIQKAVPLYIGGGGIIYPRQQIPVSYAAAGLVTNVIVKVGDQVKAGQPLLTLDQSQINLQISLAANVVAAARAYLNSVSSAVPYNPVTVANAQQQLQLAQNRYNSLTSQSNDTLHNGNLLAPAAGVVSAINVTPGQNFSAQSVLLKLIDPSTVTVHAEIPLENLTQVHNGMSATVNPSALPDQSLTGTVTAVVPQANPQTDTFEAYIQIANQQQLLIPGMSAFVRIQSQTTAFAVPRLAVLNPDREAAVFLIHNDHAYITHVHVIGHSDNSIYIDDGLSPNNLIVLLPLNRMREGQHVNIIHVQVSSFNP